MDDDTNELKQKSMPLMEGIVLRKKGLVAHELRHTFVSLPYPRHDAWAIEPSVRVSKSVQVLHASVAVLRTESVERRVV